MNKEQLIMVGKALYGDRWQTDLARDLGLPDGRRVRQWLSGERPIPDGARKTLYALLEKRKAIIQDALINLSS